jgi:hypothetical protein
MPVARFAPVAVALVLLAFAGCGPATLKEEKNYTVEAGEAKSFDLPAISKAQTINVEFTSNPAEVTVFVLKDPKGDDGAKEEPPTPAQVMGQKQGKSGTFSVPVPEKTATRVLVRGAKAKTEVTLKVTNAK